MAQADQTYNSEVFAGTLGALVENQNQIFTHLGIDPVKPVSKKRQGELERILNQRVQTM